MAISMHQTQNPWDFGEEWQRQDRFNTAEDNKNLRFDKQMKDQRAITDAALQALENYKPDVYDSSSNTNINDSNQGFLSFTENANQNNQSNNNSYIDPKFKKGPNYANISPVTVGSDSGYNSNINTNNMYSGAPTNDELLRRMVANLDPTSHDQIKDIQRLSGVTVDGMFTKDFEKLIRMIQKGKAHGGKIDERYIQGGELPGNKSGDRGTYALEDGEFVLNKKAVDGIDQMMGKGFLKYANDVMFPRGNVKEMNQGGEVTYLNHTMQQQRDLDRRKTVQKAKNDAQQLLAQKNAFVEIDQKMKEANKKRLVTQDLYRQEGAKKENKMKWLNLIPTVNLWNKMTYTNPSTGAWEPKGFFHNIDYTEDAIKRFDAQNPEFGGEDYYKRLGMGKLPFIKELAHNEGYVRAWNELHNMPVTNNSASKNSAELVNSVLGNISKNQDSIMQKFQDMEELIK